jgi:SAM-dependent methyltransferase
VTRWDRLAGEDPGRDYADRVDRRAAQTGNPHGEADLVEHLVAPHSRILDAGCGTGRVAIELARRGHDCVGVDMSDSMLSVARERAPELEWHRQDLAALGLAGRFDLVLAAGNVIPLLEEGTEPLVVRNLAAHLLPGGLLLAGFGLDPEHLPLSEAPVDLPHYDRWCADAGLVLQARWATWDREPWDGQGYAVSAHRAG